MEVKAPSGRVDVLLQASSLPLLEIVAAKQHDMDLGVAQVFLEVRGELALLSMPGSVAVLWDCLTVPCFQLPIFNASSQGRCTGPSA